MSEKPKPRIPEPSSQAEQYRARSFARCGLHDVAAMSAALRRLTSRDRSDTTDRRT